MTPGRNRPLTDILVKPAGPDCDMACAYCFYRRKSGLFPETKRHRMNDEVLARMIKSLMEGSTREVSIGWQGGEPTLMGLPFFRRAVELEKRYGEAKVVGNGLQTNGLAIDGEWARFFREYRFLIGLSIDGPEHVHDRYRRTAAGRPSWSRASDAARLLLDEGVAVNALTVVGDYSARFPDEIYEFHKETGLTHMQFIPCVEVDPDDPGKLAPFAVSAEGYGSFLCAIFDRWRADFSKGLPTTSIRFFESLLFAYAGFGPPECTLAPECGSYVVVEHTGDCYSCDFFVGPENLLGSVMDDDLASMLNCEKQARFGRLKSDLPPSCRECRWLSLCRGGCTKDRFNNPENPRVNYLCGGLAAFFEHADAELKRLVAEWQKRQEEGGRARPTAAGATGRNDPCPCGSGLKYKRCCGRA
jgi:uncharacterized protein